MDEIKNCPFCGSIAEIKKKEIDNPNPGYSGVSYFVVQCMNCLSTGHPVMIKYFNQFSKHTVDEFRQNNLLRANEEIRYEEYLNEQKNICITYWNKRENK